MRTELLPRALLVTPNIPEAAALTGLTLEADEDRREAARRITKMGASAVVIKGGHLPGAQIVDLLYDRHEFVEFRTTRVESPHTHGTGCTFAAAITALLARGLSLREAVPLAQRYVAGAIRHAPGLGRGHGPMDHLWPLMTSGRSHPIDL
jgi:hydroxymethylpyrimidine/phosphomethylpyrimidine kinase